ncbi:type I restriction endonuclease subunit R [Brevibacillus borstelensis]|uniref:type I restriction endonuclease subunit R n=1 Tax=Brevibacillus borstelensis TaxID=45462 RepID=UPI00055D8CC6|nr:type I restriction endonuclease subunit R [Brevibacillus borstelensis]MCC0567237.1 type I restriction endonuclease subunit R [Brevibacillus borstelensis]MCM3561671.1 type I restriction endonuclease subunit R [Brevibacillus borstelensis]
MNEDTLVQETTAEYMQNVLGWESENSISETYGKDSLLGRTSPKEVVLVRYLRAKLEELNPGLPSSAYEDAVRQIKEYSTSQNMLTINREKYLLLKDGVLVTYYDSKNVLQKDRLKVFDFNNAERNHFLCVREFWVKGDIYTRRADIVGFVNGIPLLFMELKNVNRDIRIAYEKNLSDYKDTVPHLFHHNAFIVLGNGIEAKVGSLSSRYEHFHEWKRLAEEDKGVVDMETLLKGICDKDNFMDLFENFILFDDSSGTTVKILAQNHQFLGVNRAVKTVTERHQRQGKLGVYWHTQGSGKSYSIIFFTRKVHRKLGGNFTFLICTDREDLDSQIYKSFAGCGLVSDRDPCRASSGEHLRALFTQHKPYIFTLIQKFNQDVDPNQPYSTRDDIIVISDEAHRTQYGRLSLNRRNALPNASYIGFTGTPLFSNDEITRQTFGDYISTYDFQRAVEDKATVPLYYDARGDKLGVAKNELNERIAEKLEQFEFEDIDLEQRLERELKRDYHVFTAGERLEQIAKDFVEHYSTAWETGKAMLVCIDKITCVRMYNYIQKYWKERTQQLELDVRNSLNEQDMIYRQRQVNWMKETQMAVVVSEEQGEVAKFQKWDLDIRPHRKLIKEGFENSNGERIDLESAFKKAEHPFRVAIVCAMWLTGFDVPSLSTLYLDKPLKAHTLMQTIARANRVSEGKNNGMIVDYCGIFKNLRQALATYAGQGDSGRDFTSGDVDPTKPATELIPDLEEAISFVRAFLKEGGASLDDIIEKTGFERNAAIVAAKDVANQNDETRKRFEIMCRAVFKKFKACLNEERVNDYRRDYDAINIIYRSLEKDRQQADISDIIQQLHGIVDEAIVTAPAQVKEESTPYNIANIDFERLRKEFEKSPAKNTTVQNLKNAIEDRLARLLKQNPLRTNFQQHYEKIVEEYNREKDRSTIEKTFEALLKLVQELGEEESRAVREGLDEESLAIFDLLKKPDLSKKETDRIKSIAAQLLQLLKEGKLKTERWKEKENTRSAVKNFIYDFLWDDSTGLPLDSYTEEEVTERSHLVFQHIFYAYPTVPSPIYASYS